MKKVGRKEGITEEMGRLEDRGEGVEEKRIAEVIKRIREEDCRGN